MAGLTTSLLVTAGLQLAGGIFGGMQANSQAKKNAKIEMENANAEAKQRAREIEALRSQQQAEFGASGVTLDGTPLMVLEDTTARGQEEIDGIMRQGRNNAAAIRNEGRNALFSGILGGAAQAGGSIYSGYQDGIFKSTAKAGGKTSPFGVRY